MFTQCYSKVKHRSMDRDHLNRIMKEKGVKTAQLAQALGISPRSFSQYKSKGFPPRHHGKLKSYLARYDGTSVTVACVTNKGRVKSWRKAGLARGKSLTEKAKLIMDEATK